MTNHYQLSEKDHDLYMPKILNMIEEVKHNLDEDRGLNFDATPLNPYILGTLLEAAGYAQADFDTNGWELDFWITYTKEDWPDLRVHGSGLFFTLGLYYERNWDDD